MRISIKTLHVTLAVSFLAFSAQPVRAQGYESFMRTDYDHGESTNATHRLWNDLAGWRYEIGRGASECDFYVTKRVDPFSPRLSLLIASADPPTLHGHVTIECVRRGTSNILYRIVLDSVTPLSIRTWTQNPETDPRPLEELQLRYLRATWTFFYYDPVTGELADTFVSTWPAP